MSHICDCTCQENATIMLPLSLGLGLNTNCLPKGLTEDQVRQIVEDAMSGSEPESCCTALHENLTLYVAPDGDDANDGLTPEAPFKSIQAAVDSTCHYISGGSDVGITIALASGDYEYVFVDFTRHFRRLTLQGQADHSSRVIGGIRAHYSGRLILRDIYCESKSGVNSDDTLESAYGTSVVLQHNVHLCGNVANVAVLTAFNSEIDIYDTLTITTKQKTHSLLCAQQGLVRIWGKINCMACDTTATLFCLHNGVIRITDDASFEGTCSGRRYLVNSAGLIAAKTGQPETAIPGATAGVAQTGGLYC